MYLVKLAYWLLYEVGWGLTYGPDQEVSISADPFTTVYFLILVSSVNYSLSNITISKESCSCKITGSSFTCSSPQKSTEWGEEAASRNEPFQDMQLG